MTLAPSVPIRPGFVAVLDFPRPPAGLAVWATGLTPAGPTKDGPGQLNTPITCGNVIVHPGDIVLADEDGVVVVPRREAAAVLERAQARVEREAGWLEHIARDDYGVL